MDNYNEWKDRKRLIDLKNKFCTLYKNDDGSMFYIEPAFYTSLMRFKELHEDKFFTILEEMDRVSSKYHLVVFTADSDEPITIIDEGVDAVYLTITDITNKLKIFIEDKSRGSDYGD